MKYEICLRIYVYNNWLIFNNIYDYYRSEGYLLNGLWNDEEGCIFKWDYDYGVIYSDTRLEGNNFDYFSILIFFINSSVYSIFISLFSFNISSFSIFIDTNDVNMYYATVLLIVNLLSSSFQIYYFQNYRNLIYFGSMYS